MIENKYSILLVILIVVLSVWCIAALPGFTQTQDCSSNTIGSAVPTCASLLGGESNSGNIAAVPVSTTTTNINQSSATTYTQLVALSSGKAIYITHIHLIAAGAVNPQLVYGTGSNCGSGTTTIDGPLPLTTTSGYSAGNGLGAIMIIPAGNALCLYTDTSAQIGGAISTAQF